MISALISGTLFRSPEERISKSGRSFATATLRVREGDSSLFVKIFGFSDHIKDEMLRLSDGDAVAIQGPLKVETQQVVLENPGDASLRQMLESFRRALRAYDDSVDASPREAARRFAEQIDNIIRERALGQAMKSSLRKGMTPFDFWHR
jgi:hypothetical protein